MYFAGGSVIKTRMVSLSAKFTEGDGTLPALFTEQDPLSALTQDTVEEGEDDDYRDSGGGVQRRSRRTIRRPLRFAKLILFLCSAGSAPVPPSLEGCDFHDTDPGTCEALYLIEDEKGRHTTFAPYIRCREKIHGPPVAVRVGDHRVWRFFCDDHHFMTTQCQVCPTASAYPKFPPTDGGWVCLDGFTKCLERHMWHSSCYSMCPHAHIRPRARGKLPMLQFTQDMRDAEVYEQRKKARLAMSFPHEVNLADRWRSFVVAVVVAMVRVVY